MSAFQISVVNLATHCTLRRGVQVFREHGDGASASPAAWPEPLNFGTVVGAESLQGPPASFRRAATCQVGNTVTLNETGGPLRRPGLSPGESSEAQNLSKIPSSGGMRGMMHLEDRIAKWQ
eukprot:433227-Hanusia_phi.AAC.1